MAFEDEAGDGPLVKERLAPAEKHLRQERWLEINEKQRSNSQPLAAGKSILQISRPGLLLRKVAPRRAVRVSTGGPVEDAVLGGNLSDLQGALH